MQGSGHVWFTEGRSVARHSTTEDVPGLVVDLYEKAGGEATPTPVTSLVAGSDASLPGVLTFDKRKGTAAAGLRVRGLTAVLSPRADAPVTEAVDLAVGGGLARAMPLMAQALSMLGLQWIPTAGAAEGPEAAHGEALGVTAARCVRAS
eukprot:2621862-Pleurochrysis_carterae.AAC.1